ncbi:MAG: HAD family hydrolase [Bryobacteraceae bacterium]|nr:HAD family hydrolase [Bryobacteraceae bacterium]
MEPAATLVLFDIDGTLLRRAGPHHRQALERAVARVAGVAVSTDGIPVAGMLDRDILLEMLARAGVRGAAARRLLPEIGRAAQNIYVRICPDLRRKVCPGVRALLRALARRGVPCGLVTGNLERIAWTKMRRAGLEEFFSVGAFSGDGPTRAALLRLAAQRARRAGLIGRGARIIYIGDHPNDIRAAREAGARIVAVGTGVVSGEALLAGQPDLYVPDLRELRAAGILDGP